MPKKTQQYTGPHEFPKGHEQHQLATHGAPTPVGHIGKQPPHSVGRSPLEHAAAARSTKRDDPEGTEIAAYQKKLMPEK